MKLAELTQSKKIFALIVMGLFVGISVQFTNPEVKNPPVTSEIKAPGAVKSILKRSCYNCHSNETKIAWYEKIAPLSWLISSDVHEARKRFNFSEWESIPKGEREGQLWEILNRVDQGSMPLKSYTFAHPSAKVSKVELEVLRNYVLSLPGTKNVDTTTIVRPDHEFKVDPHIVPTALNGIPYEDDYKKWKVISTTSRFDNGAMKIIYGNDIMVKAIKEGHINPWPDGAKIVKVVWNKQREDKDGNTHPGNLNSVQFMFKDDRKYRETEGWGFAKFLTVKLLPYGKTASFGTTCINCHRLAAENDFVFDVATRRVALNH